MFSGANNYFKKIVSDVKDFTLPTTNHKGLNKQELKALQDATHLEESEIRRLHEQFRILSGSKDEDLNMDKTQFLKVLGIQDTRILDRFFEMLDDDSDGDIDFREFIMGLRVFYDSVSVEEKIKYCFRLYDVDDDGYISKDDLLRLFEGSFEEDQQPEITEDQLGSLVDATFAEADMDGDNKLSYEEFKSLVNKSPGIISNMTFGVKKK
ncbi:serine/threonine-protein phosphatase 2B regulatory subunit [Acrasis kona]|uniref:Serine/threonine-protein phosphatase 2B regulatory subunit n=1 Tax=Acrasis kona TaxID=1008807 RepID=A0AAW2Z7Y4_9EUKA